MMKRLLTTLTSLICGLPNLLFSQEASTDFMRSTGKIYVVVTVIVLAFLGIVFYLFWMDKKLTKLENQIKNDGKS
ncbi:MAG: CcmD family protein [Bacteroidota bacterium]